MWSASGFMSSENESNALAIVNCSQLVTLAGPARPRVGGEMRELGIIEGGAPFVRDGLIANAGSLKQIEASIDAHT